jgi:hypothetical protein
MVPNNMLFSYPGRPAKRKSTMPSKPTNKRVRKVKTDVETKENAVVAPAAEHITAPGLPNIGQSPPSTAQVMPLRVLQESTQNNVRVS